GADDGRFEVISAKRGFRHGLQSFLLFKRVLEEICIMFSDHLYKVVEPIWNSDIEHPFVKGIGEGTVDQEKFVHYMKQDYIYLIEYSRVFAIGSIKENDLKRMTVCANLIHVAMNVEIDLHREYAEKF